MPKIKVNNTQGLVQQTGSGLALFNQTAEAITAAAGAPQIAASSTSVIVTTASGGKVKLPAVADVTVGTVIAINFGSSNTTNLVSEGASVLLNGANGATGLTIPANRALLCVLQNATNWAVIGMEA